MLSQIIEEEIKKFDEEFIQDKTGEKVEGYLLAKSIVFGGDQTWKIAIPNDVKSFLVSSHSRLIAEIIKMAEEEIEDWKKPVGTVYTNIAGGAVSGLQSFIAKLQVTKKE